MNFTENRFPFQLDVSDAEDVVSAIFHTVILHRTFPSLNFDRNNFMYNSVLGTMDVNCAHLQLTYVCINHPELMQRVGQTVRTFVESLTSNVSNALTKAASVKPVAASSAALASQFKGHIVLEFATHKKNWSITGGDTSPWEKWIVELEVKQFPSEEEISDNRRRLTDQLRDSLFSILDKVNQPDVYVPSMGASKAEIESVLDFSLTGVCPYRFSIGYQTASNSTLPKMNAVQRMLKNTLVS